MASGLSTRVYSGNTMRHRPRSPGKTGSYLAGPVRGPGPTEKLFRLQITNTEISQIRYPLISEHASACKPRYDPPPPLRARRPAPLSAYSAAPIFFTIFRDSFDLRVLSALSGTGLASYIVLVIGVRPAAGSGNRGIKRFKSSRTVLRRSVFEPMIFEFRIGTSCSSM